MRLTKKKTSAIVGLEIEADSIAAVELEVNGSTRLKRTAVAPLERGAFHEGEVADGERLAAALKQLFAENKLSKRVRLGIGNQRVVIRTMRLPAIEDPKEMEAAIRFQAEEQVPMPLDQAVLEHQVVGGVAGEEGAAAQVDVIVVAARRDMIAAFLKPMHAAGLEPVGIDLTAFGMIRARLGSGGDAPSLYCSFGDVTNLAVARGASCLFSRVSLAGLEPISAALASRLGLEPEHTAQWLGHVGLEQPLEQVEGDPEVVAEVRAALEQGVASLLDELRLSLDYYGAQEAALPVERIVLCGAGSVIPGVAARMQEGLGMAVETARPNALGELGGDAATRLTLPYGLALEG